MPVMVDGLNYGDIVRLAPEDDFGVRRIVEVVLASGHRHMLVAVEDGEAADLVNELERMFPSWALRVEAASATVLTVSVHPHLDADDVGAVIAAWLAEEAGRRGEPRDDRPVPVGAGPRRLGLAPERNRCGACGIRGLVVSSRIRVT